MKQLKATFDLLYRQKRLLQHSMDSITEAIAVLQTTCIHTLPTGTDSPDARNRCLICGKLLGEQIDAV